MSNLQKKKYTQMDVSNKAYTTRTIYIQNIEYFFCLPFVWIFRCVFSHGKWAKKYTHMWNGMILFEDFKMEISEMNKFNEKQTATREMRYGKMALYWTTTTKCSYHRYIFIRTYFLWSFMKYVNSKNVASYC